MLTPTTSELHTAIEVLRKLGQRINEQAAHSAMEMPRTNLGRNYAGRIEVQAIEQTTRIENVAEQLRNWREEMLQSRREHVSQTV